MKTYTKALRGGRALAVVAAAVAACAGGVYGQEAVGGDAAVVAVQELSASERLGGIAKREGVPALAAVLVRADGTVVMEGVAGVRRAGGDEAATKDDLFHLGSCTKAMTANLCAVLVQEGVLRWEMTIGEVFPEAFAEGSDAKAAWKDVTLGQLVRHRGGVPADLTKSGLWGALFAFEGTETEARQKLLMGVLAGEPKSKAGTAFLYSNAGFAIAGHMAEVKTGVAYETLIREKLFMPLGIMTAGFGAPGSVESEGADQPWGHTEKGTPVKPGKGADNPVAIAPAGTAHMTMADWAKFAAFEARAAGGTLLPSDPLKAESAAFLFEPLSVTNKKDEAAVVAKEGYAAGWRVDSRPWAKGENGTGRVLTHAGSNTMWYCVVWIAPERGFAVLAACNTGGDAGAKATDAAVSMLIERMKTE